MCNKFGDLQHMESIVVLMTRDQGHLKTNGRASVPTLTATL